MKPYTLDDAMILVEQAWRNARSTTNHDYDMWKDLTRVFTGRELFDAIIQRCESWNIDCRNVSEDSRKYTTPCGSCNRFDCDGCGEPIR
jgi:phosphatidylserine/phosphatidylglycerophosphate/cardiolipin synthase-like enzyme